MYLTDRNYYFTKILNNRKKKNGNWITGNKPETDNFILSIWMIRIGIDNIVTNCNYIIIARRVIKLWHGRNRFDSGFSFSRVAYLK